MDIPGFDRAERPPVVGNYQGKTALTDDTGEVIVTLDRGAYRMLWETMEAAALSNWRKYDSAAPAVSQASQRALRAVRSASVQYLVPAEPPKRKIRVKKK